MKRIVFTLVLIFSMQAMATNEFEKYQGTSRTFLLSYKMTDRNCPLVRVALLSAVTFASFGAGIVLFNDCDGLRNNPQTDDYDIPIYSLLTHTSNDRISLRFTTEEKNKCESFTFNLIGEHDGFGSYDLYENKEAYIQGASVGTARVVGEDFIVDIPEQVSVTSSGNKGAKCFWTFGEGIHMEMKPMPEISKRVTEAADLSHSTKKYGPRR